MEACTKNYMFSWKNINDEEKEGKIFSNNLILDKKYTRKFNVSERKSIYTVENSIYNSLIKSEPMNVYMPKHFESMANSIWNFRLRKDDIFIVTYPKCGTTLTQELMWQVTNNCPLNNEMSKIPILARAPWIELSCIFHPNGLNEEILTKPEDTLTPRERMGKDSIKFTDNFPSPRIIKSHLPVAMLPQNILDTAKILYIAR